MYFRDVTSLILAERHDIPYTSAYEEGGWLDLD